MPRGERSGAVREIHWDPTQEAVPHAGSSLFDFRSVRPFQKSIVALAHQPVSGPERGRDGREREQVPDTIVHQVENDELARDSEQSDQQYDLGLDDTLIAANDILECVVELQRDQQRHDLAEYVLKCAWVQRVKDPP